MNKMRFFPRLAYTNLKRNGQFYLPYLLTVILTAAAYYIVTALAHSTDLPQLSRYAYLAIFMNIGSFVIALFAIIFLTYTNSFLMKRRRKELGLYNILGLGKKHMALMMGIETLYTAAAGIIGGIVIGLLFQKLVTLLLCKILHMDSYFSTGISGPAIANTAILIGAVLTFNLLINLHRIHMQKPMELLTDGAAGETEPKTKRVAALFGVLCLGGGYIIALTTSDGFSALSLYFIAVTLVIIGTYLLFSAVSIVILKMMRANKSYYYKTNHFINISGMLYRMKRNAEGLASICILSTMVLVMISVTLSLYLNSEDALKKAFPGNVVVNARYDAAGSEPFDSDTMNAKAEVDIQMEGCQVTPVYDYHRLNLLTLNNNGVFEVQTGYVSQASNLSFITEDEYDKIYAAMAETKNQSANEATLPSYQDIVLKFKDSQAVTVKGRLISSDLPALGSGFTDSSDTQWVVLQNQSEMDQLYASEKSALGGKWSHMQWYSFFSVDASEDQLTSIRSTLKQSLSDMVSGNDTVTFTGAETLADYSIDYYTLNGGFFFLGLFLSVIFMMAAVLIIYYKQVSEGYEDRERYYIMQKVGMEQKTVRQSINSQILVVFFAPLIVAAVHIIFDYNMVTKLLTLFGLGESVLTLLCTIGTFIVFAALYALVYLGTARTYYRLVRRPDTE